MKWQMGPKILPTKLMILKVLTDSYSDNFVRAYCGVFCICDWICENVHSSHIRFSAFEDSHNPLGMVYRFENFRNDKGIVVL